MPNGGITNALLGANSVSNTNIADGSLSQAKISGGAAILGANNFIGPQSINGSINGSAAALSQLFVGSANAGAPFAIYGQTNVGGNAAGIFGQSNSTGSIGIVGANFGGGGVTGFDTFNIGVAGQSSNGIGVDGSVATAGVGVRSRVNNAAAKLFSGLDPGGVERFSVSGAGVINGNASGLTNLPVKYSSFVPACGLNVSGAISTTLVNLGTIGTFSKSNASSGIGIDWGGHVSVGAVSNVVQFFLMIDGNPALGNQPSGLLFSQDAGKLIFLPMHAVFTGLAAGSHNVQIWVSIPNGSASNVFENPGCYNEAVIIQEL